MKIGRSSKFIIFFPTFVCKNPKVSINKCYNEVFYLILFIFSSNAKEVIHFKYFLLISSMYLLPITAHNGVKSFLTKYSTIFYDIAFPQEINVFSLRNISVSMFHKYLMKTQVHQSKNAYFVRISLLCAF